MDVKEVNITEEQIRDCSLKLISKIKEDEFYPDVIVGLSRGGLVPAQYLAYGMDVNWIETISIQLRDNDHLPANNEINTLLSKLDEFNPIDLDVEDRKLNVLVVDDLVDTASTLKLIRAFFQAGNLDVRFATLYQNKACDNLEIKQRADYWGEDKPEGWLNFPWDTLSN